MFAASYGDEGDAYKRTAIVQRLLAAGADTSLQNAVRAEPDATRKAVGAGADAPPARREIGRAPGSVAAPAARAPRLQAAPAP